MTLFTCEGLIRAEAQLREAGSTDPIAVLHGAYERWLATQRGIPIDPAAAGLLGRQGLLHVQRAPGATCIAALEQGVVPARNDSKGCGAVMRSAPFGVLSSRELAFELARDAATITHGHPTASIAAGALAAMVFDALRARPIEDAATAALELVRKHEHGAETAAAIDMALWEAAQGRKGASSVELLGKGWVAEEALAIALLAALVGETPLDAMSIAVTHGGDSDSTGAICGNLVGASVGAERLPGEFVEGLECAELVVLVATDLHRCVVEGEAPSTRDYPAS